MKKLMFLMLGFVVILLFTQCGGGIGEEPIVAKFKVTLSKTDKQSYTCVSPTPDGYLVTKLTVDLTNTSGIYSSEMVFLDNQGTIKSSNKVSNNDALINGIIPAQNGDCIAWGSATSLVNSKRETVSAIFRVDSKGLPLWIKKIPSNLPISYTRWEYVSKVVENADKRLSIMGELRNDESGVIKETNNSYTASLAETGDIIWFKKADIFKFNNPNLIAETDGSIVASYGSYDPIAKIGLPKLDKSDANGNLLWSKSFSGIGNYIGATKVDAYYYVIANNETVSTVRLSKANANGELTVVKTFGNLKGAGRVLKTADNNLLVFCNDSSNSIIMVKMDTSGNEIWRKSLPSQTTAFDAKLCSDGGFILLTGPFSSASSEAYSIIKTDSEGNFE
jgi:hypothetical protein